MVPPSVPVAETENRQAMKIWADVYSRNKTAGGLIIDDKPGMLNNLIESTYPGTTNHPDFGEEILSEAKVIFDLKKF
jgi:hypothetical protein